MKVNKAENRAKLLQQIQVRQKVGSAIKDKRRQIYTEAVKHMQRMKIKSILSMQKITKLSIFNASTKALQQRISQFDGKMRKNKEQVNIVNPILDQIADQRYKQSQQYRQEQLYQTIVSYQQNKFEKQKKEDREQSLVINSQIEKTLKEKYKHEEKEDNIEQIQQRETQKADDKNQSITYIQEVKQKDQINIGFNASQGNILKRKEVQKKACQWFKESKQSPAALLLFQQPQQSLFGGSKSKDAKAIQKLPIPKKQKNKKESKDLELKSNNKNSIFSSDEQPSSNIFNSYISNQAIPQSNQITSNTLGIGQTNTKTFNQLFKPKKEVQNIFKLLPSTSNEPTPSLFGFLKAKEQNTLIGGGKLFQSNQSFRQVKGNEILLFGPQKNIFMQGILSKKQNNLFDSRDEVRTSFNFKEQVASPQK